jgi:phosphatidylglycerophosphate synthase
MSVVPASLRSRVRAGVEPVARIFGRVGLTPNALTVIGLLIAIAGAYLIANHFWLAGALVVAFGAVFDLFDGALARATGKVSRFGAFLDSTLDRISEAVVFIGIAWAFVDILPNVTLTAAGTMAAAFMVSYSRARAESLGFSSGTGMANIGLAPREIRMAILIAGLLAAGLWPALDLDWCNIPAPPISTPCEPSLGDGGSWLVLSLALIAFLSTITTIQRILFTYNQSRSQTQEVNH